MEKKTKQESSLTSSTTSVATEPTQFEKKIDELSAKWWARYIAGVVLFVAGGFLLDHFLGLAPGKKWNSYLHYWLWLFVLFGWGVICMKELFRFVILALIFGGLAYTFFGLLGAIPVSVAIIIGAMIIANSNAKS